PPRPGATINSRPYTPSAGLGRPLSHPEDSLRAVARVQAADSGAIRMLTFMASRKAWDPP
ncbi:MAG: hypothetical protein ACOX9B_14720, partial [Candidatus Xenobium sp.]